MFNRVKKVKNFNKFIEELHRLGPSSILIEAHRKPAPGLFSSSMTSAVGRLGAFDHSLAYTVRIGEKTKRYREPLFRVFQSEWGFADALERNTRIMSLLLAGEKRVDHLRSLFASTLIQLGDGSGQPMSPERISMLHEQAEEYGVDSAI